MRPISSESPEIAVVGCGSLGASVVRAFLETGVAHPASLIIMERDEARCAHARERFGCEALSSPSERVGKARVVVLVVKPQDAQETCRSLASVLSPKQVVLSMMAGVSCEVLSVWLQQRRIIRSMPNLPARFRRAVSVYYATPFVLGSDKQLGVSVLEALGAVLEVTDESLLDPATAVSGTGPAYFFALIEELETAACEMGFSPEQARFLVKHTVAGAARMIEEPGVDPRELRRSVTSPGGTTAAAFSLLDERRWGDTFREAVGRALARAKELGTLS